MSLPNYLAQIKSSGIYRFVWDKSEIAGVPAEILRLVVGYSEKGPFNTPVYIKKDSEFKSVFGDISKKLEKRGVFFHRLALQCLEKGPIIALNLKKFENEKVTACSFNVVDTIDLKGVPVESIYDTTRFWKLDPEAILSATGEDKKYISITSADSKETSCSLFIRGYKPTGYDVTITNWFSSQGEEVPDYFVTADGKDYSSLLVSDFFAEIYVFKGEFTTALCASAPLNKYFDIVDGKPMLKEYVENAFGEKIDTLSALASEEASNFLNSYSGCLLPFFKSQTGSYISIDLGFNADNGAHKMMMNLNSDLLYDGDVTVDQLVTTGWTADKAFGADLKHTTEAYFPEETDEFVDDVFVGKTYKYKYVDIKNEEPTAHDADFIEYCGSREYIEENRCKYIGGIEYKYAGKEPILIDEQSVDAEKFLPTSEEKFAGIDTFYLYEGETYVKEGTAFVVYDDAKLLDLVTLPVEKDDVKSYYRYEGEKVVGDDVYEFNSYADSEKQTQYSEGGTVKVLEYAEDYTSVEVLTNPGHDEFVGRTFVVKETEFIQGEVLQLFEHPEDEEGLPVYVEITEKVSEQVTYKVYHAVSEERIDDDIYVNDDKVYTKSENVYSEVEGAEIGNEISGKDSVVNPIDFQAVGLLVGDRILSEGDLYTITALESEELKAVDFKGQEIVLTPADTFKKCNHSASITSYKLRPFYFLGYDYENAAPVVLNGGRDWAKLQWHKFILSTLTDYEGIRTGLTSRTDIDFRYIVDTFEGLVDAELHKELALICKLKENALGFLNFPSMKTFKNCDYSSFTDENGKLQVKYIAEGANKKKNPAVLFSLVSEMNGASYVSYNTPLSFSDGSVKNIIPSAALVSNNFMDKYISRQPYYIVAGPNYGRILAAGLIGPEYNFTRADLDILEPMGVNAMVYVPRIGTYINSNQTAKQNPRTALSYLHVRELVIFLQDEIEKLMQDYQWEFNTPYLRDLVKAKADTICEKVKNNGGLSLYKNVCDESNNTDELINNEMFVLSTSIEPGFGAGKMIQELTIYKKGGMQAIIK